MIYQALVGSAPEAEKRLAFVLYGVPFVGQAWAFGRVLHMEGSGVLTPNMSGSGVKVPSMSGIGVVS